MKTYRIMSKAGPVYGDYQGATAEEAFQAMVVEGGAGDAAGTAEDWIIREVTLGAGVVTVAGQTVAFDAAVQQMEDELREELHDRQELDSEQAFADAYAAAHEARFGTPFRVS